jgi:hypothetical protein
VQLPARTHFLSFLRVSEVFGREGMNDKANDKANDKTNHKTNDKADKKSKFDWVTSRSSCSLPRVFAALREQVEEDVKTRNDLRPNYAPYEFSMTEDTADFTVHLKAKEVERSVTFSLGEHAILVRNNDKNGAMFQVTAILDDHGACTLSANEEEREFWQIRRMALEDLMFRQE